MGAWGRAMMGMAIVTIASGCAESMIDPVPPSTALDVPDHVPALTVRGGAKAVEETPVPTDDFWLVAPANFVAQPRVYRQSISLGFIGDEPVGREPGPRQPPWWRPFPARWTSSYYAGSYGRGFHRGYRGY